LMFSVFYQFLLLENKHWTLFVVCVVPEYQYSPLVITRGG